MTPLHQIAQNISQAFADKISINIRLANQKRDLEARQLALTPPEGWDGKNAELRDLARTRAFAADPICLQINAEITRLEDALSLAETALETAVNQRRAEEWLIRQQLIEALTGHVTTTTHDPTRVEDTAFDDWADEVADARLEEEYVNPALVGDVPWGTSDWDNPLYTMPLNGNGAGIPEDEDIPL